LDYRHEKTPGLFGGSKTISNTGDMNEASSFPQNGAYKQPDQDKTGQELSTVSKRHRRHGMKAFCRNSAADCAKISLFRAFKSGQ
jgi:hypothetical protein